MKTALSEQIEALRRVNTPPGWEQIDAAIATLTLFSRFESEVRTCLETCLSKEDPAVRRVLEVFPGSEVNVLTPSTPGVSATSQEGSVDRKSGLREGGK